ncbi:MAG: hypothetical protein IPM39_05070 [Chloroflexi bacterium]|nr:hypothetical protein [Chloroflexota bacterium]
MLEAIQRVRQQAHWPAGSADRHLEKRELRGHLPATATIADYEQIIQAVLQDASAQVFRYWYNQSAYVTVVTVIESKTWLVMFSYDGVLESAFVMDRPERYLNKPGFEWIGRLGEVENEL